MMRRSGESPAVKRSKLSRVMLRRAASGHIAATQLLKFPAASRIAAAVIGGWPEAPSSPLQGGGRPAPPPPGGRAAGPLRRRRCRGLVALRGAENAVEEVQRPAAGRGLRQPG